MSVLVEAYKGSALASESSVVNHGQDGDKGELCGSCLVPAAGVNDICMVCGVSHKWWPGSKRHGQNGDKGDSWCLVLLPIVKDICMIYGALQYCIYDKWCN